MPDPLNDDEIQREVYKAQEHDFDMVRQVVEGILGPAKKSYENILTRLWAGNGAGAGIIATTMWHNSVFHRELLWPLGFFSLGIIAMGAGATFSLIHEVRIARAAETKTSLLSMPMNTFRHLTEEAGLTMRDWRTRMALASAVLFIFGVFAGFGVLVSN
jgi:hypothetical protein